MMVYLVGTLSRYVLVEADSEGQASERALQPLRDLYEDVLKRFEKLKNVPIEIKTVRLATDEEIALMKWHNKNVAESKKYGYHVT